MQVVGLLLSPCGARPLVWSWRRSLETEFRARRSWECCSFFCTSCYLENWIPPPWVKGWGELLVIFWQHQTLLSPLHCRTFSVICQLRMAPCLTPKWLLFYPPNGCRLAGVGSLTLAKQCGTLPPPPLPSSFSLSLSVPFSPSVSLSLRFWGWTQSPMHARQATLPLGHILSLETALLSDYHILCKSLPNS